LNVNETAAEKAPGAAGGGFAAEVLKALDGLSAAVSRRLPYDSSAKDADLWRAMVEADKVRARLERLALVGLGTETDREVGGKPHVGARGLVFSFDVTLKVDTRTLARLVGETDHDVVGQLEAAHTVEHAMTAAYLNRVLEGDLVVLEAEPQSTINGGNAGFHLVTITCDGYGDVIAEAEDGAELGREEVKAGVEDPEAYDLEGAAMRLVGRVMKLTPEDDEASAEAVKKVLDQG
jgi:hypothetical protein